MLGGSPLTSYGLDESLEGDHLAIFQRQDGDCLHPHVHFSKVTICCFVYSLKRYTCGEVVR